MAAYFDHPLLTLAGRFFTSLFTNFVNVKLLDVDLLANLEAYSSSTRDARKCRCTTVQARATMLAIAVVMWICRKRLCTDL